LLERKISRFDSHYKRERMLDYTLREFLSEIQQPTFKNLITKIRSIDFENDNENQRDTLKAQLPCVTLSGVGDRKRKGATDLPKFDHSGLLQVDLDLEKHPSWEIDKIFEVVNADKHVLASFKSPSGGVKAIVPILADQESHRDCFLTVEKHFAEHGLHMCQSTKDVQRFCYLSFDPSPYIADGFVDVFYPSEKTTQKHRNKETKKQRNTSELVFCAAPEWFDIFEEIEDLTDRWLHDSESDPLAVSLWIKFIYERYEPDLSKRNEVLVNFIKYSHARMSRRCAMILARQIHRLWSNICKADEKTHMRSAESLWDGCESTYISFLNSTEKYVYLRIKKPQIKDTFRICQDLANREKCGLGKFFLSSRNLGLRLGMDHSTAWKYIRKLKNRGIIQEFKQGTQGINGSASEFQWMLK
jgi:hypothetical protein